MLLNHVCGRIIKVWVFSGIEIRFTLYIGYICKRGETRKKGDTGDVVFSFNLQKQPSSPLTKNTVLSFPLYNI
jgi:hypothetical protein